MGGSTLTTELVRTHWTVCDSQPGTRETNRDMFDAWLARVNREAEDKAWEEGYKEALGDIREAMHELGESLQ